MIRRIFCSLPSFKPLTLKPGLNVIVSKKTQKATQTQTRNSAGKSSIIEIIHFLLGADVSTGTKEEGSGKVQRKRSIFLHELLIDHEFGMDFELAGVWLSVYRSGKTPSKVRLEVLDGDPTGWPLNPFQLLQQVDVGVTEWKRLLGVLTFRLSEPVKGEPTAHRPSYRSLISYFGRRVSGDGFLEPVSSSRRQKAVDQHVSLGYLFGLDWTLYAEGQALKERQDGLKTLTKVAGGELSGVIGKAADLLGELTNLEEQVKERRTTVSSFRVLPTFHEYHERAESLSRELREMRNQHQADYRLLNELRAAITTEAPPQLPDVKALYAELGVVLPEHAVRRFDEVQAFHDSVIANRKSYLESELFETEGRIAARNRQMEKIDRQRSSTYQMLSTGGALEDLTSMQRDLSEKEGMATVLRNRYETAKTIEATRTELDLEKMKIHQRIQRDLNEREAIIAKANGAIRRISTSMYGKPGRLRVEATELGIDISVKIEGDRGQGIGKMAIFAFDIMLSRISAERGIGPSFLLHDSHLYDGVDSRQRAMALTAGKQEMADIGRQYIVCMNSDELPAPNDCPPGFSIDQDINPIALTDEKETGGIFGIRFD